MAECSQLLSKIDDSLTYQSYFLRHMNMVEVLLLFTRASRQRLWELHLYSLSEMVNYFFSPDQINYARLSSVYLPTMSQLQESDPVACCYLKENFEIAKSDILFTASGSDNTMEQENKVLKVNIFF